MPTFATTSRSASKVADGDATTVIFANGFLSEGKTGWGDWERTVRERYPDATVYRLTWGARSSSP